MPPETPAPKPSEPKVRIIRYSPWIPRESDPAKATPEGINQDGKTPIVDLRKRDPEERPDPNQK